MSFPGRRFHPRVFFLATCVSAIILVTIVAIPQWLSKHARLDVLRDHVGQIADLASSVMDGDLHRQLLDPASYSPDLYNRAVRPLVRFHSANPEIFYVYTMVERDGGTYFVLDTAASPDLHVGRSLRASAYMERFQIRKEYESDWLQQIAAGNTWVTPTFQQDDYGDFLTAHKAIYDSQNRYVGFVGVDFDLQYYLSQEVRFQKIGTWSLVAALIVSLLIGYIVALYHFDLNHRIEEHYHTSIRDGLTGLLNRRGAPDCDADGAAEIARRILSAVATPRDELSGASFSVSIGIAVQDQSSAGFERMYREADAALYHAKSRGKHRFSCFEASMAPDASLV